MRRLSRREPEQPTVESFNNRVLACTVVVAVVTRLGYPRTPLGTTISPASIVTVPAFRSIWLRRNATSSDQRNESLPAGPPRIIDADMVEKTLAQLNERIDQMVAGLTQVQTRRSSISTEITNQLGELGELGELGNEIDALTTRLSDQGNVIGAEILTERSKPPL